MTATLLRRAWIGLAIATVLWEIALGRASVGPVITYSIALWVCFMVCNATAGSRLLAYLRDHHRDTWLTLTYGTTGSYRSWPAMRFLFGTQHADDPEVVRLRANARDVAVLGLLIFAHFPPLFLLLQLLSMPVR